MDDFKGGKVEHSDTKGRRRKMEQKGLDGVRYGKAGQRRE